MSITETSIRIKPPHRDGALRAYVGGACPRIEEALMRHLPFAPSQAGARFNEALHSALFPGGKRLRPVLTLLGAELVGGQPDAALRAAVAVEYVHTSSLIFDDLPCMDDALERRGQTCLHLRYDEGLAVLVALALMNASYGLVFDDGMTKPERAISAHAELVACIGTGGMVTGQTVDLSNAASRDGFDAIRNLKTSALMRLAIRLGAILSGANSRQLSALLCFAELLGQSYQISDDVLDLAEDAALAGGGARLSTLAFERGVEAAQQRVAALAAQAKDVLLSEFGQTRPARLLCEMADYITTRNS